MASDNGEEWGCLFVGVLAVWAGFAFLTPDDWRMRYAVRSMVWPGNVYIPKKPTDCDFMHAPLGSKDCSYAPIASNLLLRKAKDSELLESSWDSGKTWSSVPWTPSGPETPHEPGEYILVYWSKETGE